MPAPTPTVRVTPTERMFRRGYRALITNSLDPDICIWEKSVQPAGLDNGEPIDTTHMFRNERTGKARQALDEATDSVIVGGYTGATKNKLLALVGKDATITELLPDGSTYCYFGYYRSAAFGALTPAGHPEVTVTIVETDEDADGNEQLPVFAQGSGT